jgi:hypothetical protein
MNTTEQTYRIGSTTYGRPFFDHNLRPMVQVWEDDGDRYVTYAVPASLLEMVLIEQVEA